MKKDQKKPLWVTGEFHKELKEAVAIGSWKSFEEYLSMLHKNYKKNNLKK